MVRHGRQVRADKRGKDTGYDDKLNSCIEVIEAKCPDQWNFILAHIDSEAVIPPNRFYRRGVTDNEIAREAFARNAMGKLFARLARFQEQDEEVEE
jgi:hypothetical protein